MISLLCSGRDEEPPRACSFTDFQVGRIFPHFQIFPRTRMWIPLCRYLVDVAPLSCPMLFGTDSPSLTVGPFCTRGLHYFFLPLSLPKFGSVPPFSSSLVFFFFYFSSFMERLSASLLRANCSPRCRRFSAFLLGQILDGGFARVRVRGLFVIPCAAVLVLYRKLSHFPPDSPSSIVSLPNFLPPSLP